MLEAIVRGLFTVTLIPAILSLLILVFVYVPYLKIGAPSDYTFASIPNSPGYNRLLLFCCGSLVLFLFSTSLFGYVRDAALLEMIWPLLGACFFAIPLLFLGKSAGRPLSSRYKGNKKKNTAIEADKRLYLIFTFLILLVVLMIVFLKSGNF